MILIGSIATFHAEIASLFGQTLNSEQGAGGVTARPYSTLVDPNSVVVNFNDTYTRSVLDKMEIKCMGSTGVCMQTTKGLEGIETSGAVGTKKFLDKQLQRIMMAFEDLLDKPGNESLKAKFRDLANVGYELADLQRKLAKAIKKGDKAEIAALIAQINGGSVTYRVDNGDGTYTLTTITGDQTGSIIDRLRQLRNEIMNDPRLASITGGAAALDALYDVLEYDALSASTLVEGPPPSSSATTVADAVKSGGDTTGTGMVVQSSTTKGPSASTEFSIKNVINLVNSDPTLAAEMTSLATRETNVKSSVATASAAYGSDSDEASDIITKAAKALASNPDFATANSSQQKDMLEKLLKDWEDGDNDTVDDDVAEDLRKDVSGGGSITTVMLDAARLEADKKALSEKINNTLISNNTYSDKNVVSKVVDTAASDASVVNDMTSGDSTTVATKVEDKSATDAATAETESAAASTEDNATTSCSVGDGTKSSTTGNASSCIG